MADPARQFDYDDEQAAAPKPWRPQVHTGQSEGDGQPAARGQLSSVPNSTYDNKINEPSAAPGQNKQTAPDKQGLGSAEKQPDTKGSVAESQESSRLPDHEGQIASGFRKINSARDRLKSLSFRKKATLAGLLATAVTSILLMIVSFLPFELIHLRHVVTDQIAGTEAHVYQVGRGKLYSTQFFFDEKNQYSGSKVGGVRRLMMENRKTKAMVAALEKNGYRVDFEVIDGRQTGRIKSLKQVDGSGKILREYTNNTDLQRAWDVRKSGDLPKIMKEVFPDKSDFWANRATKKLYRRWGLTRTNWLKETFAEKTGANAVNRKLITVEEKFKSALRQKLFGVPDKPDPKLGTVSKEQQDAAVKADPTSGSQDLANELDADNKYIQGLVDEADALRTKALADPNFNYSSASKNALDLSGGDLAKAMEKSLTDGTLAKSAASSVSLKALSVLKVPQQACSANTALNTVEMGARILRAQQLMRFSLSVLTIADAVQNGKKVSPQEVNAMMQYLNSKDSNGKNLFASSGYRYWANNDKSALFSGFDKNQRDDYAVGGGFTAYLSQARGYINTYIHGGQVCHKLNNPFVVAGGFVVGGVAAFFTAGTSVILNVAAGVTSGVAVSYITNLATSILTPMLAGTVINGSEQGTAVGNAFISGAEVLTNANASTTGMRAYTKDEYKVALAQVQADQKTQLARLPIAERLFSPNVNSSLTTSTSVALAGFKPADLVKAPIASLGNLFKFGGLFGEKALADNSVSCPDPEINDHNLAATPLCNPIMGIPDSAMNNPDYAPDKIDDTINLAANTNGTPNVDENGDPIKDSLYDQYLKQCAADSADSNDTNTGGIDVLHTHGDPANYTYTNKCTNDLFNTYRLYMTIAQGENDALTGNLGTGTTTAETTPTDTPSAAVGDAQALAKQILSNSNISLNGFTPSPLADVQAAAKGQLGTAGAFTSSKILQLIATIGQSHKVLVTAIQSNGQGHCHNTPKSGCPTNSHYNGWGVDFGSLDGRALTGRDPGSVTIINIAVGLLPKGSGFGQSLCKPATNIPPDFEQFDDPCTHLHIEVPNNTP